jgi:acetyl esterase/lipase
VISLDYRLAPEHPFPAALHDTYDALRWLEEHGEAFGGDGRVVAGGQSAGANLVAAASLMARDRGRPAEQPDGVPQHVPREHHLGQPEAHARGHPRALRAAVDDVRSVSGGVR